MTTSTSIPPFDIDAYISRYDATSETRLQRLIFLAHQFHFHAAAAQQQQAAHAFDLAVSQMKSTGNYRRYLEEFGAAESSNRSEEHPPEMTSSPHRSKEQTLQQHPHPPRSPVIQHYMRYDPSFPAESKAAAQNQLEVLEGRLSTAQSHINKASIRTALLALGEFHWGRGELREGWRRVVRSRDYCMNGVQHSNVNLLLVEMSIDTKDWPNARDTIARAEHTVQGDSGDPLFPQKLRAANALVLLAEGKYYDAAKLFASVSLDLTNQFSSVLSAEDLAMYGALLGLATFDREKLHSLVIDGPFKGRLELVPAMRDALRHYSLAEYGQCISILQSSVRRDILLDIHLHAHVPVLLDMIRDRCIVQYFQPYSSVSLEKMGKVFGYNESDMEDIVANLIINGGVQGMSLGEGARINSLEKTLNVYSTSCVERKARRRARVKAAKMGINFVRNAEGLIMRVACLENGLVIQGGSGRSTRGSRARDAAGKQTSDRMATDVLDRSESDGSFSDDAMEVDEHGIANPNDF
eukprot:CCRYP_012795-RB/>CCRYP_012795-RB protein AED:0.08 eAED:0.08 QI:33/1/1/1/1/1/5/63/522